MEHKYTVTTPTELYSMCCKNGWFKKGTNSQYEKLFYANEGNMTIEEMALIIWLCSEDDIIDIYDELLAANIRYHEILKGE